MAAKKVKALVGGGCDSACPAGVCQCMYADAHMHTHHRQRAFAHTNSSGVQTTKAGSPGITCIR